MAIDPKLLVIKPVSELAEVTGLQDGSMLFYDGSDNLKLIDIDTFNNLSKSAKLLKISDTTPTEEGLYKPATTGTYPNGLTAQEGFTTLFFFDGTTWSKSEEELPQANQNIAQFEDLSFPETNTPTKKVQTVFDGGFYQLKEGETATITDLPTDDPSKWEIVNFDPYITNKSAGTEIINYDNYTQGQIRSSNGTIVFNSEYEMSELVPLENSSNILISGFFGSGNGIFTFDENETIVRYISAVELGGGVNVQYNDINFIKQSNEAYLEISTRIDAVNKIQITYQYPDKIKTTAQELVNEIDITKNVVKNYRKTKDDKSIINSDLVFENGYFLRTIEGAQFGSQISNDSLKTSDFIDISGIGSITVTTTGIGSENGLIFYNKDKTPLFALTSADIGGSPSNVTRKIKDSSVAFFRVSIPLAFSFSAVIKYKIDDSEYIKSQDLKDMWGVKENTNLLLNPPLNSGKLNDDGSGVTANVGFKYSNFIPVKKEDIISYKLRSDNQGTLLLAFYSASNFASFENKLVVNDVNVGEGTPQNIEGKTIIEEDGFIVVGYRDYLYTVGDLYLHNSATEKITYYTVNDVLAGVSGNNIYLQDLGFSPDKSEAENTNIWNQAISKAQASGQVIVIPNGRFKVKEIDTKEVSILGLGTNSVLTTETGSFVLKTSFIPHEHDNGRRGKRGIIGNFKIDGNNRTAHGWDIAFFPYSVVNDIFFANCNDALLGSGLILSVFNNLVFYKCNLAIRNSLYNINGSYFAANAVTFNNTIITSCVRCVDWQGGSGVYFNQIDFENCGDDTTLNDYLIKLYNNVPENTNITDMVMKNAWSEHCKAKGMILLESNGRLRINDSNLWYVNYNVEHCVMNDGGKVLIDNTILRLFSGSEIVTKNGGITKVINFSEVNSHSEETGGTFIDESN